jgi:hypothetical protein
MQYTSSLPFRGDQAKAFELAASALTALGFRLTERTESSLQFVGPGMNSSRESGLMGATGIRISGDRDQLSLEADLGGMARLSRFAMFFPLGLFLAIAIVSAVVLAVLHGPGDWMFAVAAPMGVMAIIWSVLGPLMARSFRARTERALDTLLSNMVSVGESA